MGTMLTTIMSARAKDKLLFHRLLIVHISFLDCVIFPGQ